MPQDLCAREGVADEDVLRGHNSEHVSNVAFEVAKQAKVSSTDSWQGHGCAGLFAAWACSGGLQPVSSVHSRGGVCHNKFASKLTTMSSHP